MMKMGVLSRRVIMPIGEGVDAREGRVDDQLNPALAVINHQFTTASIYHCLANETRRRASGSFKEEASEMKGRSWQTSKATLSHQDEESGRVEQGC